MDDLKQAAREATGGTWRAHITRSRSPEVYTDGAPPNTPNPLICGRIPRKADARYIALASPDRILSLISEVERLRKLLAELVAYGCSNPDAHPAYMAARQALGGGDA